jgi:hypothetical protein
MAVDLDRRAFWRAHIAAWRESGLTQRAYCHRESLPEAQLSHWKHRQAKAQRRGLTKRSLIPIEVLEPAPSELGSAGGAAPVGVPAATAALSVVFGRGLRLEIGEGFHPATLRQVLEVLGDVG